jgi:hypothetical protein
VTTRDDNSVGRNIADDIDNDESHADEDDVASATEMGESRPL